MEKGSEFEKEYQEYRERFPQEISSEMGSEKTNPVFAFFKKVGTIIFGHPLRTILIILVLFIIVGGAFAGLKLLGQKLTPLYFIPKDAEYYLSIRINPEDPQVKQGRVLLDRFPGGEKGVEVIKEVFIELFSRPQDPFEDILSLAEDEIFLAKISPEEERREIVEELVNIVELGDEMKVQDAVKKLQEKPDYTFEEESYHDRSLYYAKRPELDTAGREIPIHPIPYQVTVPYSIDTYFTTLNNFIVAGDKKGDIENIIELINAQKKSIFGKKEIENIFADEDHQEVASHFPEKPLVKFYQKQEILPHLGIFPLELITGPLTQGQAPTQEAFQKFSASLFDNIFQEAQSKEKETKISRAFTIETEERGVNFTFYQIHKETVRIRDAFLFSSSLAHEIPDPLNERDISIYLETKNLKGKFEDLRKNLRELAKETEDEDMKRTYEYQLEGIDEFLKEGSEFLNLDIEKDFLSWMDNHMAFVFAPGFHGDHPIGMWVFRINDQQKVEEHLKKLAIKNVFSSSRREALDARRESDIRQLSLALEIYFDDNEAYPETLSKLVEAGFFHEVPKDPKTEENYHYEYIEPKSFILYANLDDGRKYIVEMRDGEEVKRGYEGEITKELDDRIRPEVSEYQGTKIYRLDIWTEPPYEVSFLFSVLPTKVVFTHDEDALKQIIDLENNKQMRVFAKTDGFKEQFDGAAKIIGGLYYVEPYGFWGVAEFVMRMFNEGERVNLEEQIGEDNALLIKSYLQTLKHIGGYFTLRGKTIINPTLFYIEELPPTVKQSAEEAIERVLKQMEEGEVHSRDARRISGLRQISLAMEMYYDDGQAYLTTAGGVNAVSSIGSYLDSVPRDPQNEEPYVYHWVDNSGDDQKYCVWARLETGGYFIASHEGTMELPDLTTDPKTLSDCERVSEQSF